MLQKIPVEINTPEWLALKQDYIGCSDIPILTGSSNYSSPIVVYYQKIGLPPPQKPMAERPFMGHIHEPIILDLWQYWEGKEKYVENYMIGKKIRRFLKNDGYILVNSDIPFLSVTPDGTIPAGEMDLHGAILDRDSPLQAKNIDSLKWHQYDGFIPEHQEQVHGEMLVFGTQYAELASLVGGNELYIEQCEFNEGISNAILSICSKFWYDRVVPGKELVKRFKAETRKVERDAIMKDIYALEPEPDDSEIYRSFLSERFQRLEDPNKRLKASPAMETLLDRWQLLQEVGTVIKKEQTLIKNTFLKIHEHKGASLILGEDGRKSAMSKRHTVSGRDFTPEEIKQVINKLN